MAIEVFVYDGSNGQMQVYNLELNETMPYATTNTLLVGEFRGSSTSNTIWTDRKAMECWNKLRAAWGSNIYIPFAFKRIWEGGHGFQSQHYAGMAIDMGQNLNETDRENLRQLAKDINCYSYVEPPSIAPTWVHVDTRLGPPACAAGYPELKLGDINTYVLLLQDALNTLGYSTGGLDGRFGMNTENAVMAFQKSQELMPTGIVDCATWTILTRLVKGMGQTQTTINP